MRSMQIFGNKGFILWPRGFSLDAYKAVISNPDIATGYVNTITILLFGTVLNLLMTSMGAFVITRKKFKIAKPYKQHNCKGYTIYKHSTEVA